jgi:hypothetical protein
MTQLEPFEYPAPLSDGWNVPYEAILDDIRDAHNATDSALAGKVDDDELANAVAAELVGYVTASGLATALSSYVTASALASTLSGYATTSTLSGYATTSALSTGLSGKAPTSHTHPAADIADSTAVGRALMKAADATAGRSAIGAGTSNLAVGSSATDAKAGNYAPAAADVSDSTALGRSVLTAASLTAARNALGFYDIANGGLTAGIPTGSTIFEALT